MALIYSRWSDVFNQGHEASGTVADFGLEVKGFKKGDRIGWLLYTGTFKYSETCTG